jgi:hypothetical protein
MPEGQLVRQARIEDSILVPMLAEAQIRHRHWEGYVQSGFRKGKPAGLSLQMEFGKDMKLGYIVDVEFPGVPRSFTIDGTYSLGAGNGVTLKLNEKDHVVKVDIDGDKLTMTDRLGITIYFKKVE